MRKLQILTAATVLMGIVSFLCLLGYFLALHDIYQDYASPRVLYEQADISPKTLADWIACPLEWNMIRSGYWPMLVFHFMALLTIFLRTGKRRV